MKPSGASFRHDNPRFEDTFDDVEEAEVALENADRAATGPASREFIDNLYAAFEQYGMRAYLSWEQRKWLLELANK